MMKTQIRECFRKLKELADQVQELKFGLCPMYMSYRWECPMIMQLPLKKGRQWYELEQR